MQADGKKIIDSNKQNSLASRLRLELLRPLRVAVVSRGPDTELLVTNPVELSGKGRPLVFHDISLSLKILNTGVFSVLILLTYKFDWPCYALKTRDDRVLCLGISRIENHNLLNILSVFVFFFRSPSLLKNFVILISFGNCFAQAEIRRHIIGDREWEVYRVLLDEGDGSAIPRSTIERGVWKILLGWE